ncbi:MAG: hypothetical protein IKL13_05075 [Clostridia bacterium]|nr:hypothetical protein [Clostridia bacterium]
MGRAWKGALVVMLALLLWVSVWPLTVAADDPVWDGAAKTVTMKAGEEQRYIYIPAADGNYTISQSTSVIRTSFEQADLIDKDAEPIPVHVEGKANPNDECYRLKGGVRYIVRMSMWEGHTEWPNGLTDTISIYAGEPKKEIDLCTPYPANGELKLTVKPGDTYKYKFTPSTTDYYVLYSANTVVDVRLAHGPDDMGMPENQLMIANPFGVMHGYLTQLTAGETYMIWFSMWEGHPDREGFTDTYYLQKVSGMKAAELRSAYDHKTTDLYGYVGGHIQLFPYTDPLYYEAFTTEWSISDTSVAQFVTGSDHKQTRELELKKAGTVTVTAMVDGKAVSKTITVKDRPVLEVGKSTRLTFGGTLGVQCAFTPAESGTYRFAMTGAGGTTVIQDTGYATYWEGSGSLSARLTAGKTYILEGAFGPADYTVKVTKGGSSTPTNPAPPSGDEPGSTTSSSASQPSAEPTDEPVVAPTDTTASAADKKPAHKVPVHHENGKGNVRYEDVAHLLGEGETLTVTVEDSAVTTVSLPVQALAEAAQADTTLRVELSHATVTLDATVLARAAAAAEGEAVELTVDRVRPDTLAESQQAKLKNKEVAAVVRLTLTGGAEIHELGGTAAVTIPFTPEKGKSLKDYTVYYLSADGKLEKMKTTVTQGGLTFLTTHFSDYVMMYEPQTEQKPAVAPLTVILCVAGALLIMGGGVVSILLLSKKR